MKFVEKLKKIIKKLDLFSPYPLLYSFVMSEPEKNIFDEAIKTSKTYLEFGLGGSSLRALQKSKAKIYAVESSPEWIKHMRQYMIIRYFERTRLFIFSVDIGPTKEWGYPVSNNAQNLFEAYSSSVYEVINSKEIDLALIDGRFRVACTLKLILECHQNDNIKILIHDFWNREQYHILLNYLDILNRADTIGYFAIKNNVDIKSVERDYEIYKLNPS